LGRETSNDTAWLASTRGYAGTAYNPTERKRGNPQATAQKLSNETPTTDSVTLVATETERALDTAQNAKWSSSRKRKLPWDPVRQSINHTEDGRIKRCCQKLDFQSCTIVDLTEEDSEEGVNPGTNSKQPSESPHTLSETTKFRPRSKSVHPTIIVSKGKDELRPGCVAQAGHEERTSSDITILAQSDDTSSTKYRERLTTIDKELLEAYLESHRRLKKSLQDKS